MIIMYYKYVLYKFAKFFEKVNGWEDEGDSVDAIDVDFRKAFNNEVVIDSEAVALRNLGCVHQEKSVVGHLLCEDMAEGNDPRSLGIVPKNIEENLGKAMQSVIDSEAVALRNLHSVHQDKRYNTCDELKGIMVVQESTSNHCKTEDGDDDNSAAPRVQYHSEKELDDAKSSSNTSNTEIPENKPHAAGKFESSNKAVQADSDSVPSYNDPKTDYKFVNDAHNATQSDKLQKNVPMKAAESDSLVNAAESASLINAAQQALQVDKQNQNVVNLIFSSVLGYNHDNNSKLNAELNESVCESCDSDNVMPQVSDTVAAQVSDTVVPRGSDTVTPQASDTIVPYDSDTVRPQASDTILPHSSDTVAMHAFDTVVPQSSDTVTTQAFDAVVPYSSGTVAAQASDTILPHGPDTVTPQSSDTVVPRGSDTVTPQASDTIVPYGSDTVRPQASDTILPHGSDTVAMQALDTVVPQSSDTVTRQAFDTVVPYSSGTVAAQASDTILPHGPDTVTPQSSDTVIPSSVTIVPSGEESNVKFGISLLALYKLLIFTNFLVQVSGNDISEKTKTIWIHSHNNPTTFDCPNGSSFFVVSVDGIVTVGSGSPVNLTFGNDMRACLVEGAWRVTIGSAYSFISRVTVDCLRKTPDTNYDLLGEFWVTKENTALSIVENSDCIEFFQLSVSADGPYKQLGSCKQIGIYNSEKCTVNKTKDNCTLTLLNVNDFKNNKIVCYRPTNGGKHRFENIYVIKSPDQFENVDGQEAGSSTEKVFEPSEGEPSKDEPSKEEPSKDESSKHLFLVIIVQIIISAAPFIFALFTYGVLIVYQNSGRPSSRDELQDI